MKTAKPNDRKCSVCRKSLAGQQRMYCGDRCKGAAWREANPGKVRVRHEVYRKTYPLKVRASHRRYREANRDRVRACNKAYCEEHPERRREASAAYYVANSERMLATGKAYREAHPEKERARQGRRRARKAGAIHVPYNREAIFERDNYSCKALHCRFPSRKISRRRKKPDPRSASIGHIIPLDNSRAPSWGPGDDAPWNVQTEHLGCNAGKANRANGEQPSLWLGNGNHAHRT